MESPDELAAEQLDKRKLILFNAGDEHSFNDQLGKTTAAYMVAHESSFQSINFDAVALVDTACTLCMHSKHWRQHFEQFLPPGLASGFTFGGFFGGRRMVMRFTGRGDQLQAGSEELAKDCD